MIVTVEPLVKENSVRITVICPEGWLHDNCEALPPEIAEQITVEQGIAIIQNAVIMAMGYTRKRNEATALSKGEK